MNMDDRKVGLRECRVGLNLLIDFILYYSFNRLQLSLRANKYVLSLFIIHEPPNIFIIALVNCAHTYYGDMIMINGWTILDNSLYL